MIAICASKELEWVLCSRHARGAEVFGIGTGHRGELRRKTPRVNKN
jgi:hypothetical protein